MQAIEPTLPPLRKDEYGVYRVGGTRVSLESLVIAFDQGATPEQIVDRYPSLDLTSVYEVVAYVLRHRATVDEYLKEREKKVVEVRTEVERRFPPAGFRARLEARLEAGRSTQK